MLKENKSKKDIKISVQSCKAKKSLFSCNYTRYGITIRL